MRESSEKLNNQAIRFAQRGEYFDAIACLKRAITVENSNFLLWFNLGITYRDAGDFKNAKDSMVRSNWPKTCCGLQNFHTHHGRP